MKKRLIILCTAQSLLVFAPSKNKQRTFLHSTQAVSQKNVTNDKKQVEEEIFDPEKSLTSSQRFFKGETLPIETHASSNFLLDVPSNSPQEGKEIFLKEEQNEGSFDDLSTLNNQTHREVNFPEQVATTAYSCFRTAKKIGAQYGLLSRIKYYNEIVTSQQAHADYIASTATKANPHKGYHDLENAILEAILSNTIENIKAALDLFEKIYPYKSYLTPEALKKISEASGKYQQHLDYEFRSATVTYLKQTRLTTSLKAEADKVDGASNFSTQEDKRLLNATEKTVEYLKEFASKNNSNQNKNDDDNDDFRNDDE